jgi:hypothetical protein
MEHPDGSDLRFQRQKRIHHSQPTRYLVDDLTSRFHSLTQGKGAGGDFAISQAPPVSNFFYYCTVVGSAGGLICPVVLASI